MHDASFAPTEFADLGWEEPGSLPEMGVVVPVAAAHHPEATAHLTNPSQAGHLSMTASAPRGDVYRPAPTQDPLPPPIMPMQRRMMPPDQQFPRGTPARALGASDLATGGLGLRILVLASSVAAGAYRGSWPGALAGGLFAGAAMNGYDAVSAFRRAEDGASKSALFSIVALVGGGVIWYRYVHTRARPNPETSDPPSVRSGLRHADPCNIRPAGP